MITAEHLKLITGMADQIVHPQDQDKVREKLIDIGDQLGRLPVDASGNRGVIGHAPVFGIANRQILMTRMATWENGKWFAVFRWHDTTWNGDPIARHLKTERFWFKQAVAENELYLQLQRRDR